ncbi:S41 family peptidase [Kordiimonas aestuarii]|uniref:S41 family peptidase n=1 Tax=Kordiimonas aestuarii TaxID=1005925 RepID=UPI0021D14DC2|nr:S41 family peptidase [Kordiimonas aestuarii]
MKSIFSVVCVAVVLMHGSPLWADAAQDKTEAHLLGLIKQFSLTEIDEAACLQDIRKELRGSRGDDCFGPFDRIIGGWKEEAARKDWQEDTDTVSVDVPGDWAYVRITRFGLNTADEFYTAVSDIEQNHIVLDLRQNGGGRLDQAIKMALMVVDPDGDAPVYTETKRDSEAEDFSLITKTFHVQELAERFYPDKRDRVGSLRDKRFAILINDHTYSACEILAEIMRRLNSDNVFLVGRQTFGKWTAQAWFPFEDAEGNKRRLGYTVLRYAPGADKAPPAHVMPDFKRTYSLRRDGELGVATDRVYTFAIRQLFRKAR